MGLMRFFSLCLLLIVYALPSEGFSRFDNKRISSDPYISGDGFRAIADHIFDETNDNFFPQKVRRGQTVFVKTDFLGYFFEKHFPKISQPFVLISHNGDASAPSVYRAFLDDPKILAWFAQNIDTKPHPKLHPIPIGIANYRWGHGKVQTFQQAEKQRVGLSKNCLLYMNFELETHSERVTTYQFFKNALFCETAAKRPHKEYLLDMAQAKFVVSPRGNGLDCHRTWEALLMGAYPVVKTSTLDPLYQDLPVLIVEDWEELTEDGLQKKHEELQKKTYKMEKIYMKYWINLIRSYQEKSL